MGTLLLAAAPPDALSHSLTLRTTPLTRSAAAAAAAEIGATSGWQAYIDFSQTALPVLLCGVNALYSPESYGGDDSALDGIGARARLHACMGKRDPPARPPARLRLHTFLPAHLPA